MRTERLTCSSTAPKYRVYFENETEAKASLNELVNVCEDFNYGGSIDYRDEYQVTLTVYID